MNMHRKSDIAIVMASDDKYAQHMGVAALSVAECCSNPGFLHFYFLDAGISEANVAAVRTLLAVKGAQCTFLKPDLSRLAHLPIRRYGIGTYLRLTMASVLPAHLRRIIYVDCDVLAFDDLSELWNFDLKGEVIGAVANLGHQPADLVGSAENTYFNAGVLVVDLHKWRTESVEERVMAFMNSEGDTLRFLDQDALNMVFAGHWTPLPLRWNQQPATYSMLAKGSFQAPHSHGEFQEAISCPGIVHYLGRNKPWHYMTSHPLKSVYWAYLCTTPWSGYRMPDKSWKNRIRKMLSLGKELKRFVRMRKTSVRYRTVKTSCP